MLRKYSGELPPSKPSSIGDRSWAIYTAYLYKDLPLDEISSRYRLSPGRVRRIVAEVEAQVARPGAGETKFIALESPLEDLGLSVRARNVLRGIGCETVGDAMQLDLSRTARGLGLKTRQELLGLLERAGFHHAALDQQPASEIRTLERSLERMQNRVEAALGSVAREIRLLKQRLRKRVESSRRNRTGIVNGRS
jgi:hypothetical protein